MLGNRYEIIKLIGKGGMADVYLAMDTILNREVAIKILKDNLSSDPVALQRFSREALASTELSHPNIVDVYDVGDDNDKHYIVMEYVNGYTLKQLIKKRGAIPYKEAVWMIKQLSGALMEAHRKKMIHRDVKSQNVLIKNDGTIKLTDFGIALAQGAMQITSKDSILGSVHYIAPEITKGQVATMQSDIYSLGIVFYELLTGDVPFKADSAVQVALQHLKGHIPSVRRFDPKIPQSVENILIKATAKSCENRYKNIALMIQDLNNCLKPEYLNCPKLELNKQLEKEVSNIHVNNEYKLPDKKKKKKNNTKNAFSLIFIFLIVIISLLAVFVILVLSGVIGSGGNKMVEVPDVRGYTIIEASDILDQYKISIDTSDLTWELTDDLAEGVIISTNPAADAKVEINTKLSATVSSGKYAILKDYAGDSMEEAKDELENLGFLVKVNKTESSMKAGLVVSTEPEANSKYDPSNPGTLIINYSPYKEITLPIELKGADIKKACNYFDDLNIEYKLVKKDLSYFAEVDVDDIDPNCVVYTTPSLGLTCEQTDSFVIEIYYYEDED
ncbi:MAG: Stk1 family PASTA domain-containing Ser/Thr kinase [Erysipelotrichaceae bacterium]|nr:Stk1 family PASTA domain-containing Ser/Thr kinase [Erysipelotrichaceae bacterium]